jgi:uncharacterized damage-inducible protein DinB
MTYTQLILPEFDREMATTRKLLERVPEDKLDWKPHPKSNTIGWNANHLVELPGFAVTVVTQPQLDFAPVGGTRRESPKLRTRRELLELFDRNIAAAREALAKVRDQDLNQPWTLRAGERVIFTMPRAMVMRMFVLSHMIHHRAVLSVYLRLNDIPVPAMYGPSGDEQA